jgi:hypothetical protein
MLSVFTQQYIVYPITSHRQYSFKIVKEIEAIKYKNVNRPNTRDHFLYRGINFYMLHFRFYIFPDLRVNANEMRPYH